MRFLPLTITIILFAGMLVWFGKIAYQKPAKTGTVTETVNLPLLTEPRITFVDPIRGNRDATVTIVEFADYRCEFCKQEESVLREVLAAYSDEVRLVWKDFPNDYLNAQASASAAAARCAGQQSKYWEYHDLLFSRTGEAALISYTDLAASLGLDRTAFDNCLKTREMMPLVQKSLEEAQMLRLEGAPSFFINGRPFNGTGFEEFKIVIDGLLKK